MKRLPGTKWRKKVFVQFCAVDHNALSFASCSCQTYSLTVGILSLLLQKILYFYFLFPIEDFNVRFLYIDCRVPYCYASIIRFYKTSSNLFDFLRSRLTSFNSDEFDRYQARNKLTRHFLRIGTKIEYL